MSEMKDPENFLKCCIINNCQQPGCDNYKVRRDLIQKIIDGQANDSEQALYDEVITKCNNCQCKQYCEQELAIKSLIQSKLDRKRVPLDVLEKIKTAITKTP
jgi:hypothetical protein